MNLFTSRSIRSRLISSLLIALTVILGFTAWKSYTVSHHESEEIFRARLATSARVLEALVAKSIAHSTLNNPIIIRLPYELEVDSNGKNNIAGHEYEAKIAFQVWHDDGRLLARSFSAPSTPLSPENAGFSEQVVSGERWLTFTLHSGETWIQVAEHNEILEELADEISFSIMTPMIIGSLILLLAANLLVRFGLNPLTVLAARIAQRTPDTLTEIEITDVPREVEPVIAALNSLLRSMRAALDRERRFNDAAAHELRTPLAALKIHADNLLRANTEDQRQSSEKQLIKGLDRTLRLANQMLLLSRTQCDLERPETMHVAVVLSEVIAQQEPLFALKHQTVETHISIPEGQDLVIGQPIKLHQLFRNLLDNASRYGLPESIIRGELTRDGNRIRIAIANDGPTIPVEMREKVFEPYTRLTGSKVQGSGLGLAIAREIADQHGAEIAIDGATSGTVVTVSFPAFNPASETSL
ncbi:MAG: ATP-binding protein [Sulfuricellaceae bacterium]|nr:ATP-binding protein [Sulfuricellaceae bacterium]